MTAMAWPVSICPCWAQMDRSFKQGIALADTGSNRTMMLARVAHQIETINNESCDSAGGTFHPKRKALAILPHPVVGSNIEAGYVVEKSTMPTNCDVLLGTGALDRLKVDAAEHCELAAAKTGEIPMCCYRAPKPITTANATVTGNNKDKHRVIWDGTVDERLE